MPDALSSSTHSPMTWKLALPDWAEMDDVWHYPLPFALWTVGEQPLLYHWLDAAVDQESYHITLYVADRPDEVRKVMEAAQLWPIEWEIKSVAKIDLSKCDDIVNRLPRTPKDPEALPRDGWSLIRYWRKLENDWLKIFTEETASLGPLAAIGRHCEIAESANLIQPYWIGDFVSIGPNCTIGPNVVIEAGSIVSGGNQIEDAHIGKNTYMGPEIDLISAALLRNQLLNLKHQARIDNLESFLADHVDKDESEKSREAIKTNWKERIYAMCLLIKWWPHRNHPTETIESIDGNFWRRPISRLPRHRSTWLRAVICGKMKLFGVTPRTEAELEALPDDWQEILRHAPAGAFTFADVMGEHEAGSMEEAMHCIYQLKGDPERSEGLMHLWIQQRISKRIQSQI